MERTIDHRDKTCRGHTPREYLVRWEHDTAEHDTWEEDATLRLPNGAPVESLEEDPRNAMLDEDEDGNSGSVYIAYARQCARTHAWGAGTLARTHPRATFPAAARCRAKGRGSACAAPGNGRGALGRRSRAVGFPASAAEKNITVNKPTV